MTGQSHRPMRLYNVMPRTIQFQSDICGMRIGATEGREILNVSIVEAAHEYIIMTDGDCIPRGDFLEVHANRAEKGKFLSGGYCKLTMKTSKAITKDERSGS